MTLAIVLGLSLLGVPNENSGLVQGRIINHCVLVPVRVGERETWAFLDTGAAYTGLSDRYFKEVGKDGSLSIGFGATTLKVKKTEFDISVLPEALSLVSGVKVEMLLGIDALNGKHLRIDYQKGTVEIADRIGASGLQKVAEMRRVSGRRWAAPSKYGKKARWMLVDTGASAFSLDELPSGGTLIGSHLADVAEADGLAAYPAFIATDFSVGNQKVPFVSGILDEPDRAFEGVIGTGLIAKSTVLMDLQAGALYTDGPPTAEQGLMDAIASMVGQPLTMEEGLLKMKVLGRTATVEELGGVPARRPFERLQRDGLKAMGAELIDLNRAMATHDLAAIRFSDGQPAQVRTLALGIDPGYPRAPVVRIHLPGQRERYVLPGTRSGPWPADTIRSSQMDGIRVTPVDLKDPKGPIYIECLLVPRA
ncbi:hypothetical protein EON81_07650 [bacterium]|nr:MAG: hypothetical protein EON81_07650 [bacterium]